MKAPLLHLAAALAALVPALSSAQTIVDEWPNVKAPAAPTLKPVSVDPKTTALLMLDFVTPNCNPRPRCLASVPGAKKLLTEARSRGMTIVHSTTSATKAADIVADLAPRAEEPVVASGVDKFRGTDLEKILKDKGIEQVIAIGTAAHGAVMYTASGAVLRGMKVVLPVDGISAGDAYPEQYVAWHLTNAPVIGPNVTLTKFDLLKF
ncbi:MAG TPA: isochorismatase family protein [Burkholderiaceae bacterium]|nr:isochorismatase family protein [Burkholderiaceae bacterium]